jgi:hypothetical protein
MLLLWPEVHETLQALRREVVALDMMEGARRRSERFAAAV